MKRFVLMLCSALVCCFLCVSCAREGQDLRPTDRLTLYCSEHEQSTMRNAIARFQKLYPEVEVDLQTYSNRTVEYAQTLRAEVMAGQGPDLLLFGDYEFQDIEKAMEAGVFFDINTFLDQDDSFDISLFQPNVFNGGCYKGKRCYIPLDYVAMSAVTTEETMRAFGISLSDSASLETWMRAFVEWRQAHEDSTQVLMNCGVESPYYYCTFFNVQFLNLETGEFLIDNPAFPLFMEFLKDHFPQLRYGENDPRFSSNRKLEQAILDDQLLCHVHVLHQEWNLDICKTLSEERTARSFVLPSMEGEQPVANSHRLAAINTGSPNKYNAYAFLKVLLSTEIQLQDSYTIPVNNEALATKLQLTKVRVGLTEDEIDAMYEDFQGLGYAHPLSYTQYYLFEDAMRPWFQDEKSYEDCLEDFRNRLELFADE